jgi:hypothetical protein
MCPSFITTNLLTLCKKIEFALLRCRIRFDGHDSAVNEHSEIADDFI